MNDASCLFCKIAQGEIGSVKIYENESIFAFVDIKPVNPGHVLVIPKKHFESFYDLSDEIITPLFKTVRDIAVAIKKSLKADGVNIHINNEKAAGQAVFHAHIHVIPRFTGDGFLHWPGHDIGKEEMEIISKKIQDAL
jgi:histidine triad (HIT) family protein